MSDSALSAAVNKLIPAGCVISSLATGMSGWLRCNGQLVSCTTYAALYAAIGDMFKQEGDTDTSLFRLPDFRNRVMWGAWGNLGTYLEAGLPNIVGAAQAARLGYNSSLATSGALAAVASTLTGAAKEDAATGAKITLDASKSNAIYGNSDTVQPPAVAVNVFIKY